MNHTTLFVLIFIFSVSLCKVFIYGPRELREIFSTQNGELPSSYANFGNIPYGTTLVGRAYYFENNTDGCEKFDVPVFDLEGDPDGEVTPIILVDRGNCSFVKKAQNIQDLGGSLAIIIDNKPLENPEKIIMIDDGKGGSIHIPVILISKRDGQLIKEFLIESLEEKSKLTTLMAQFEMENPDDRVEYDIWYSSASIAALKFMYNFHKYNTLLGKHALMTPHFVIWTCPGCEEEEMNNDCFVHGRYCAPPYPAGRSLKGTQILREDLREKCIYLNYMEDGDDGEKYWKYMDCVFEDCAESLEEKCSFNCMDEAEISSNKIKKCLDDSFKGGDNELLEEEMNAWIALGGAYYPAIVINNRTYRGNLDAENVFNSICAGFNVTPEECDTVFDPVTGKQKSKKTNVSYSLIVTIVVLLVILNLILIYCYRRYSKREIREEMQFQINSAMTQYFALTGSNLDKKPLVS